MSQLLQGALDLIDMGFAVFPLEPRGKEPYARFAPNGFKSATRDKDIVKIWWRKVPTCNIGVPTGDGFFVLDTDGENAEAALRYLCLMNGMLPPTLTVKTGSGYHRYFRTNAAIQCSTGKLAKGIDIKGIGGYAAVHRQPRSRRRHMIRLAVCMMMFRPQYGDKKDTEPVSEDEELLRLFRRDIARLVWRHAVRRLALAKGLENWRPKPLPESITRFLVTPDYKENMSIKADPK
jgi:Bifunctional DNA primase/polymerase, N-terminal